MASANGQPMSGSNHIPSSGDVDGNRWCGWAGGEGLDGVMVFNKGRELIGRIDLPERCANVCFGGYRRSRLFTAASRSLYALWVGTSGG